MTRRTMLISIVGVLLAGSPRGAAQSSTSDDWPRADEAVEALVTDGRIDELEKKLSTAPAIEKNHLLARARLHRARQITDAKQRAELFAEADTLFTEWIAALEKDARRGQVRAVLHLAKARTLHANTLLAMRVDPELIDFEASNGEFGNRAALRTLLDVCRSEYRKAEREMAPYLERGTQEEDQVLLENLEEDFRNAQLDLTMNLGWTHYYLGVVHEGAATERRALHAQAERAFQELVGLELEGRMKAICHLALAMSQREQQRLGDAARNFDAALRSAATFDLTARIRYELARGQLAENLYEAARETLQPLTSRAPRELAESERPGRLYVQLAHLLAGTSFLREAQAKVKERQDEIARTQAQRLREAGLTRLKIVSGWGPPWPALVRIHIAAGADRDTPPDQLTPLELLCTAQVLAGGGQPEAALERLLVASRREHADDELKADILYELGRVQYQLDDRRAAALTFDTLAREHPKHLRAAQSAAFAYQLWGRVAEQTKAPSDYEKLADTLAYALTNFPDHPGHEEALWLLPRALQLAGRFEQATERYAALPESHPRWEEAQYRRTLCARDALAASRKTLPADTLRSRGAGVAELLAAYARDALARAEASDKRDTVLSWSAEALAAAGELLDSTGIEAHEDALRTLARFESDYPKSALVGRVLAVRIRALRGLNRFDEARKSLAEYVRTATPAEVGPTLTSLARSMQDEVERATAAGRAEDAKRLAGEAAETFAELEQWVEREGRREGQLELVQRGRLEMCYLAGDYAAALRLVDALLARNPRSGLQQHRRAAILTAMLAPDAPHETVEAAQKAWSTVLADESIRRRAPDRYWEARYNWLMLHARLGHAQEVAEAIYEESRWRTDLGGEAWRPRFETLYRSSGGQKTLEAAPTTATTPATLEPG